MQTLTISQLATILIKEVRKGNGDKKILLTTDDEGNGCHECFFGVSPTNNGTIDYMCMPYGVSYEDAYKNYMLLG